MQPVEGTCKPLALEKPAPLMDGSHAFAVRQANERAVLTALRRLGEASKADLARHVNLTQNTAGRIVKDLQRRGLVMATSKRVGLRGQPATLLRLDRDGDYAIGIKLGRRTQQSVLVDFSGEVLRSRFRECAHPMPEDALALMRSDIAVLREALPGRGAARISGVGLAIPYNYGNWRRELDMPEAVCAAWNDFDIGAELGASLDVPVHVENDGTAAAVAELFRGHGRTLKDFAVLTIGAGIGGGLVLGGNYRRGVTGNAADVGLMPVGPSRLATAPTPAGGSDILLNRASAGSLMRHLRANDVRIVLTSQLDEAVALRPDLVDEWLEDCAEALMEPVFTMASLLDLEAVVIDGLLPRALLKTLVTRLAALMLRHAPEARKPPMLLTGILGRDAAALGAATLPFYFNYAQDKDLLAASRSTNAAEVAAAL